MKLQRSRAFIPLQADVFVACVMCQHRHGRDREHHAEEGCRAGAAGRGADHRRAAEVGVSTLSATPHPPPPAPTPTPPCRELAELSHP